MASTGTRGGSSGTLKSMASPAEQNNFILDGVDNNIDVSDYINGFSYNIAPPPDALQEIKILTSNTSAEFGHGHGAVLNASIKPGTNQIHGAIWEYVRNTVPHESIWRDPGLPIIRNKLFYFGDFQDSRYSYSSPSVMSTLTPLMRQGNFTELLNPAFTGRACPTVLYVANSNTGSYPSSTSTSKAPTGQLQQYGTSQNGIFGPGQNVFNPAALDPVAQNILKQYPLPNYGTWAGQSGVSNTSTTMGQTYNNLIENLTVQSTPVQWDEHIDWNISAKDQAYFVYDYQHQMDYFSSPLGPILDGYGSNTGTT